MILDEWNILAFQHYAKPLRKLEKAHNKNGNPIILSAFVDPFGNKLVRIIGGKAAKRVVCIEGASPAQAVKDVALAVAV